MRFVHRVLVGGLMLGCSVPALAIRTAPQAGTRKPGMMAKPAVKVGAKAGSLTMTPTRARSAFRFMTPLRNFEQGEYATVKGLLSELHQGTLASSFMDKGHTAAIDHHDLRPRWNAYNAEVRSRANNSALPYESEDTVFARHFEGTGLGGWRDYYSLSPQLKTAYPIGRDVPTQSAASPLHAAVHELDARTSARPEGKRMLAAALRDPLTMALVLHVGARAELFNKTDERSQAARTIYDGVAKVLQAQDREAHGPGLAHIFPEQKDVFHFKTSRMWSNATSREQQIMSLSRETILAAARGVLTKAELNEAIIGLDL